MVKPCAARQLVDEAAAIGVHFRVERRQLFTRGPRGAISASLRDRIKQHRELLLDHLEAADSAQRAQAAEAAAIVEEARALGVSFHADAGKLRTRGPRGAIDAALAARIGACRDALLASIQPVGTAAGRRLRVTRVAGQPGAPVPLSHTQERLWFIDRMGGGSAQYNVPVAMRVRGEFDPERLERALQRIVDRHAPLRSVYVERSGRPACEPHADGRLRLVRTSLESLDPGAADARVQEVMAEFASRPYDLSSDLMLRGEYLRLGPEDGVLLLCIHHIATDGWSFGVIAAELGSLYASADPSAEDLLPPLAVEYSDYVRCQREWIGSPGYSQQLEYWRGQLAKLPLLHAIPTDRPRPLRQSFHGDQHVVQVGLDLRLRLEVVARRAKVTLFMLLHAVYSLLLSRLSGSTDVVVGTPVMYRPEPVLEPLVGCFVNTLVLRVDCGGEGSFLDFLDHVKSVNLDAQENQDIGLEQLVELLRPARSTSHSPLFQVLFAMNVPEPPAAGESELDIREMKLPWHSVKFDLVLTATPRDDGIRLEFERCVDLFEQATLERMASRYLAMLEAIAAEPATSLATLAAPRDGERDGLKELARGPELEPVASYAHCRFEAAAAATPDAVAVVHDEQRVSFAELNVAANRLARHLRELGVGPEQRVALCLDRSVAQLVAVLAVWKAGGAFVPIDPMQPVPYRKSCLQDSGAAVLITQRGIAVSTSGSIRQVLIDDPRVLADIAEQPGGDLQVGEVGLAPANLAYVIYTSGSSGAPKGVMVEHRNLDHLAAALPRFLQQSGIGIEGAWAWNAPLAFDASLQGLLHLAAGSCLHVLGEALRRDPPRLLLRLCEQGIDVLDATPLQVEMLLDAVDAADTSLALPNLVIGGEAIPPELWQRIANHMAAHGRVAVNVYGPTETTVDATGAVIVAGEAPHIGRPFPGTECLVLGPSGELLPVGASGELHVAGPGVARGYLGRAVLSAQCFFTGHASECRLYRTGDRVRWRNDGKLEFIDRADDQVKIRGHRVEPDEVAAHLSDVRGVAQAVVLASGKGGDRQLVGHVVPARGTSVDPAWVLGLRTVLRNRLPEYMVPSRIIVHAELPMTANGKLDRSLLAEADSAHAKVVESKSSQGAESLVAELLGEALGISALSPDDNFFELGGHSMLAVRAVARLASVFPLRIPLDRFFDAPTPRAIKRYLAAELGGEVVLEEIAELYREVSSMTDDEISGQLESVESR